MTPRDPLLPGPRIVDLEPRTTYPVLLDPKCIPTHRNGTLLAKTLDSSTIGLVVPLYRPNNWDLLGGKEFRVAVWEREGKRYISFPDYIYEFYNLLHKKVRFTSAPAICIMHTV